MDHRFLSRIWNFTIFSMDLQSQDTFAVRVIPEYERLNRNFRLHPSLVLPSGGEYNFVRYRVNASTANRRVIAVAPAIEWGGFYGGSRRQVNFDAVLRLRPGVIMYLANEWNTVRLPQGSFQARVHRFSPELQFNQWISWVNTVQYDSVSSVLGWQSRFRWIIVPGTDLYFVYTHNWLDDPTLDGYSTLNRRAAMKALYTHRF
jgi:hypothetical protein